LIGVDKVKVLFFEWAQVLLAPVSTLAVNLHVSRVNNTEMKGEYPKLYYLLVRLLLKECQLYFSKALQILNQH